MRVTFASPCSITLTITLVGDGMGMSVFVTTPIFFFLLLAPNERRLDWRFVVFGLFGLVFSALGARQNWTWWTSALAIVVARRRRRPAP